MYREIIYQQIKERIEKIHPELIGISKYIYENPELGHEEWKASECLCKALEK